MTLTASAQKARIDSPLLLGEAADDEDFLCTTAGIATEAGSVILLSGGAPDIGEEARYSIAAWDPYASLQSKGTRCRLKVGNRVKEIHDNAITVFDDFFSQFSPDPIPSTLSFPFLGGAVGYFAYDLKNSIERLPETAQDDLGLPDLCLFWPRKILLHDRLRRSLYGVIVRYEDDFKQTEANPWPSKSPSWSVPEWIIGPLRSNFTKEEYLRAVAKVRHYIREGDVYQVNLSQRFSFPFLGDPFHLWWALYRLNPAPFYAFVHGGEHHILSTSMERFLLRRGNSIETRPIKGTRKRGASETEDAALREDLANDPKDDAELSMIVDLLRNDLGRVCSPKSIRVDEHKRLESYENVHHLVSIVKGELRPGTAYGDILRATFPGGSITGCPKIRAMEIIDELEPCVRHVYTGSIGYLGWHGNMDLNIAIRTGLIRDGRCHFSVGGGIVYDSSLEAEYEETLHKGRTLFRLIERTNGGAA